MKFRPVAAVAALLATAPLAVALAQGTPPQVQRHELMEAIGDATGVLGAMAKGERPYDAAAADAQLDIIARDARAFVEQFPEGSETGHDTRALPAIWANFDTFTADAEKLAVAATNAKQATAGGLEAFRPAFGQVGQTCRGCHQEFRAPER